MRVTAKICEISNLKACQKFLDFSDVVIHSVHIFHRHSIIKKEVSMVIWLMSGGRYQSRCGDEIRVLKNQWKTTFHFNDRISTIVSPDYSYSIFRKCAIHPWKNHGMVTTCETRTCSFKILRKLTWQFFKMTNLFKIAFPFCFLYLNNILRFFIIGP